LGFGLSSGAFAVRFIGSGLFSIFGRLTQKNGMKEKIQPSQLSNAFFFVFWGTFQLPNQ